MTNEFFEKAVDERIKKCRETLIVKAREYARTDREHNFRRAAQIMQCSKERALLGFAMKHLVSILDILDDIENGNKRPSAAQWDEKIGDLLNYLLILDVMVRATRMEAARLKERMHSLNQKGSNAHVAGGDWYLTNPDLFGTWERFSETWPKRGTMRNGECWELPTLERPTEENDSGSSLCFKPTHHVPTPTASDHIERKSTSKEKMNPETNKSVSLDRWVKFWPTPRAHESGKYQRDRGQKGKERPTLTGMVQMWPTPRAGKTSDEKEETWLKRQRDGKVSTPPLSLAVKMFPTLTRRDYRSPDLPGSGNRKRKEAAGWTLDLPSSVGGQLNPPWVEWLMGWPIGWTDLKPLETGKFQEWLQKFGDF